MKKMYVIVAVLAGLLPLLAGADEAGFLDIRPIPSSEFNVHHAAGVGEYNGEGKIDGVYSRRIVINDRSFYLSPAVKLTRMDGTVYSGRLKKEMYVYYFFNHEGVIEKVVIDTGY